MSDLAFLSATELAAKIQAKEVSSTELLQEYFDRVDQYNPDLNAVVVEVRDQAQKDAAQADADLAKGKLQGALHGVPMTIKESYNLKGTATTWGNPDWKDNIAQEDAVPVQKLKGEGSVVFGKTNIPLALADFQSYNDVYGTTNNPYNHARIPGGSSGGSAAALAAGLTGLEIGSDIGGSIRNPAHFCGVFGHKPTWGMLWMRGHSGPGDSRSMPDISVIGPLARSATDLATAVNIMAGPDEIAARGLKLELPTLGERKLGDLKVAVWAEDDMCPIDKEVLDRVLLVAQQFKDAGAQVNENARPAFTTDHSHETYQDLLQATMASRIPEQDYEAAKKYVARLDPNDNGPTARTLKAQVSSFKTWNANNDLRNHLRWHWHEFFKEYDLVLTPVMPTAAFEHNQAPFSERTMTVNNEERPYFEQVFWAGLTGVSYLPSTVIPTGLNNQGLPIGVQIVGPEYSDLITIGAAQQLEAAGFRFTPPRDYL